MRHDTPSAIDTVRNALTQPPRLQGMLVIVHDMGRRRRRDLKPKEAAHRISAHLDRLRDRGFCGIVCNVSDRGDYLRDEDAWDDFGLLLREATAMGLRVWLYDESGYPSGTAGGQVPRQRPDLEAMGLVRLVDNVAAGPVRLSPTLAQCYPVHARALPPGEPQEITQDITQAFTNDGGLAWDAPAPCAIERYVTRRAFEETHATLNVHAVRRYINVLEPEATQCFIKLTHEQYLARFGDLLPMVDAVFTDEPSFMTTYHPPLPARFVDRVPVEDQPDPNVQRLPMLPWWRGLPEAFVQRHGYDIRPHLSQLFEDGEGAQHEVAADVRQDFHDLLGRQYAKAYFEPLQEWAEHHDMQLTGHLLHEEPLLHHVSTQAHAMRALAAMGLPGCDLLDGTPRGILETARLFAPKYAASAAHLTRREEVMSEVSDWEQQNLGRAATLRERYAALALQVMLGVTTFTSYFRWDNLPQDDVRHLTAAIHRLCALARLGNHVAPVALWYPIRAVWADFTPDDRWIGSDDGTDRLQHLERTWQTAARNLLGRQYDFDIVDETHWQQGEPAAGGWKLADKVFRVVVLPPGTLVDAPSARALERFHEAGGTILALRPDPMVRLDEQPSGRRAPLLPDAVKAFDAPDDAWLESLATHLPPAVRLDPPTRDVVVRHARHGACDAYLLVNCSEDDYIGHVALPESYDVMEAWDPWTGGQAPTSSLTIEGHGARVLLASHTQQA